MQFLRKKLFPLALRWTVKSSVSTRVLVRASFVPIKFALRSGTLDGQVRPDRADRCSAGGDNHRSELLITRSPDRGDRTHWAKVLSPLSGLLASWSPKSGGCHHRHSIYRPYRGFPSNSVCFTPVGHDKIWGKRYLSRGRVNTSFLTAQLYASGSAPVISEKCRKSKRFHVS